MPIFDNNDLDLVIDDNPIDNNGDNNVEVGDTTTPQQIPGNVQPQIPNDSAPFIVLCGPPSSGKSMVLKSLASYLFNLYRNQNSGYSIRANETLLNSDVYHRHCQIFDYIIADQYIPMQNTVDYLMADIIDGNGNVVAHFLEAPGEDFFSLTNSAQEPRIEFKSYLSNIARVGGNIKRKVIYVILLDLDSPTSFRNDCKLREKYQQKMEQLYKNFVMHHPCKVILLYNKVDIPMRGAWANSAGVTNLEAIMKDAKEQYPRLFFKKRFLFWNINNYSFLPYCTGSYSQGNYVPCGDIYPAQLWKEITKFW